MAIIEVNNWLNGNRNYDAGVRLYQKLGTNQVFKTLFAKSQNPYTERKLAECLQEINLATAPPDRLPEGDTNKRRPTALQAFEVKQEHTFEVVDLSMAPAALQKLDALRKQLYQQAATEKERLSAGYYRTAEERFAALKIIDDNFYGFKGIQAIWQRIDYWKKHGQFIPFTATPAVQPITRDELIEKRNTLRTYVSRYRHKPAKAHLFNKYQNELMSIEQKLMDNGTE